MPRHQIYCQCVSVKSSHSPPEHWFRKTSCPFLCSFLFSNTWQSSLRPECDPGSCGQVATARAPSPHHQAGQSSLIQGVAPREITFMKAPIKQEKHSTQVFSVKNVVAPSLYLLSFVIKFCILQKARNISAWKGNTISIVLSAFLSWQ